MKNEMMAQNLIKKGCPVKLPSVRTLDFLAFISCVLLLSFGIFLELVIKLEPCPLCIMQRLVFILLGILFLVGSFLDFRPRGRFIFHLIISLVALLGAVLAGRQVWLEHLPPSQVPSCGANLKYILQVLPVQQALKVVFLGTGSCAKVTWRFLGLSIPAWALISFIFFTAFAFWQGLRSGGDRTN